MEYVAVAVTVESFYSFFIKMHDNVTCCRADSQVLFHSLHVSVKTQMACFFCQPFVFCFFCTAPALHWLVVRLPKGKSTPRCRKSSFLLWPADSLTAETDRAKTFTPVWDTRLKQELSLLLFPPFFSLSRWHPNTNSHWVLEQLSSRCSDSLLITPSRIHALQIG